MLLFLLFLSFIVSHDYLFAFCIHLFRHCLFHSWSVNAFNATNINPFMTFSFSRTVGCWNEQNKNLKSISFIFTSFTIQFSIVLTQFYTFVFSFSLSFCYFIFIYRSTSRTWAPRRLSFPFVIATRSNATHCHWTCYSNF